MTAELAPVQRSDRLPSCSDACEPAYLARATHPPYWVLVHDLASHEAFWQAQHTRRILTAGLIRLDLDAQRVTVCDRPATLTPLEWRILEHLATHAGTPRSARQLHEAVWPGEAFIENGRADGVSGHAMRVNVCRLRAKLFPMGGRIQSRSGFGYQLDTDETEAVNA